MSLQNVAVQVRPVTGRTSAAGNRIVAACEVTIPDIGTIRDILIQETPNGEYRAFGPSRLSYGKEANESKYYSIVHLAVPLRQVIITAFLRQKVAP